MNKTKKTSYADRAKGVKYNKQYLNEMATDLSKYLGAHRFGMEQLKDIILGYMDCPKWDVNEIWSEIPISTFILGFGLSDILKDIGDAEHKHCVKMEKITIRKSPVSFCKSLNNYIYDFTSNKIMNHIQLKLDMKTRILFPDEDCYFVIKDENRNIIYRRENIFENVYDFFEENGIEYFTTQFLLNIFIDKPIKTGMRYGFYIGLGGDLIDLHTCVLSDYFLKPYNTECCLCFENIGENSFIIHCGHSFHKSCFDKCNNDYLDKIFVQTCIKNGCKHHLENGIPFLYQFCKCPLCKNFEMLSKSTVIYVRK